MNQSRLIAAVRNFWLYFVPVLVWMGVIFTLSSQPAFGTAGNLSFFEYILRKGAHVGEYFVLGALSFRLFSRYFSGSHAISAGTVLLALLYALSDEAHQLFVSGRQGRISDVGIDTIGIFLALFFCLVILPWWQRYRETS